MEPLRFHSLRDLALAADVSPQTITRLVFREATSNETVSAVARALKVNEERIWALFGRSSDITPFRLPIDADRLSPRQRTAVLAVVRAMLDPAVAKGDAHAEPATEKTDDLTVRRDRRQPREKLAARHTRLDPSFEDN
jgi:hypothetical protein